MARNLSSSNPNPLFALYNDDMDHFLFSLNSTLDQNHMNESGLINSQNHGSNPTIRAYHQRGQAIVSHGQLGLSQRMTEIRRTYVAPHRIQVHNAIDYFSEQQSQTIFSQNAIIVTEVVRTTKFLTSSLTMEPLPTSNTIFNIQG